MKNILLWLKEKQYLVYYGCAMAMLDFYLRIMNRNSESFSFLNPIPNMFTIFWILLLCLIIYIIKNKKDFYFNYQCSIYIVDVYKFDIF